MSGTERPGLAAGDPRLVAAVVPVRDGVVVGVKVAE